MPFIFRLFPLTSQAPSISRNRIIPPPRPINPRPIHAIILLLPPSPQPPNPAPAPIPLPIPIPTQSQHIPYTPPSPSKDSKLSYESYLPPTQHRAAQPKRADPRRQRRRQRGTQKRRSMQFRQIVRRILGVEAEVLEEEGEFVDEGRGGQEAF